MGWETYREKGYRYEAKRGEWDYKVLLLPVTTEEILETAKKEENEDLRKVVEGLPEDTVFWSGGFRAEHTQLASSMSLYIPYWVEGKGIQKHETPEDALEFIEGRIGAFKDAFGELLADFNSREAA